MLLTIRQAAEALQVSPNFVYRLVASRLIRHERHGRGRRAMIRIPQDALEEYRRSKTVAAEAGRERPPTPPKKQRKAGPSDLRMKHLGQ